jgi:hypothetical protein
MLFGWNPVLCGRSEEKEGRCVDFAGLSKERCGRDSKLAAGRSVFIGSAGSKLSFVVSSLKSSFSSFVTFSLEGSDLNSV